VPGGSIAPYRIRMYADPKFSTYLDLHRRQCSTGSIFLKFFLLFFFLLLSTYGVPLAAPSLCPIEDCRSAKIFAP